MNEERMVLVDLHLSFLLVSVLCVIIFLSLMLCHLMLTAFWVPTFPFSLLLLVLGDSPSFLLVCFRCTKTARGHPDARAPALVVERKGNLPVRTLVAWTFGDYSLQVVSILTCVFFSCCTTCLLFIST